MDARRSAGFAVNRPKSSTRLSSRLKNTSACQLSELTDSDSIADSRMYRLGIFYTLYAASPIFTAPAAAKSNNVGTSTSRSAISMYPTESAQ